MTPETLRIDRHFAGVGRIARVTGTTDPVVRNKISRMLTALYEDGRLDILRALRDCSLEFLQVYDAFRRRALHELPLGQTGELLAVAMKKWIDSLVVPDEVSKKHAESLETSRRYFERHNAKAQVSDLPEILEALRNSLGQKHPRSFNLARSAALAFVRSTLKRAHPLWLGVSAVEIRKTKPRQGSPLSITQMKGFFPNPDTDHVDGIAWSMATSGMGANEYWGRWHVAEDRLHIAGTKRAGRVRDVPLVRTPVVPKVHRRTFEDAVRDRTNRAIAPYDFRRTYAHWLELANIPRTRRRMYMGHGTGDVTELYERHDVDDYLAQDRERLVALFAGKSDVIDHHGAKKPQRRRGVRVYFIQREGSGAIKIGIAKDPLARLRELQIGSEHALALLGVVPGGRNREREIHRLFAGLHIRGEWFRGEASLLTWIRNEIAADTHGSAHGDVETSLQLKRIK